MSETHQDSGGGNGDFDLTQFYQIFFEEAGENLDLMEQMLLNLNLEMADDEVLNGIFRCAHSVKGGAATFGFTDVAELTHQMESLLDRLRRHELQPNAAMVDVLLESADASRSLLARHQAGGEGDVTPTSDLVRRISALATGQVSVAVVQEHVPQQVAAPAQLAETKGQIKNSLRSLEIRIGPLERPEQADAVQELFKDIPGLGEISVLPVDVPKTRLFVVKTASSDEDLLDLFAFHVSRDYIQISEPDVESGALVVPVVREDGGAPNSVDDAQPGAPLAPLPGYGFFDGAPGAPTATNADALTDAKVPKVPVKVASPNAASQPEAATIRVAISKVDQLINLVGELVITQAMLAQNSRALDPAVYQQLLSGLADLDRNTRDLQESVIKPFHQVTQ